KGDTVGARLASAAPKEYNPRDWETVDFKGDGELKFHEFSFRLGLLFAAGIFLLEGIGYPWTTGFFSGASFLISALLILTMAVRWRVLGDWRRQTQKILLVVSALVVWIPIV